MCYRERETHVKQKKRVRIRCDNSFSLLFLRCPSHVNLGGFFLFVSENGRIFQGDAEPQLTPADHAFSNEVCFAFGIMNGDIPFFIRTPSPPPMEGTIPPVLCVPIQIPTPHLCARSQIPTSQCVTEILIPNLLL